LATGLAFAGGANSRDNTLGISVAENALATGLAFAGGANSRHNTLGISVAENALATQQSLARQTRLTSDRLIDSTRSDQQQHRTDHTTNDPDL